MFVPDRAGAGKQMSPSQATSPKPSLFVPCYNAIALARRATGQNPDPDGLSEPVSCLIYWKLAGL